MWPGLCDMEGIQLRDSRLRLISAVLALVSVGLLLSLLPHTSFVSHGADDIVDAVGPVWPDQSVEQLMDKGLEVVSDVRIWAAAESDRGEAPTGPGGLGAGATLLPACSVAGDGVRAARSGWSFKARRRFLGQCGRRGRGSRFRGGSGSEPRCIGGEDGWGGGPNGWR